ncbi:MAG: endolytic transglycosylase MltG [Patescibacteria group bacterium]|jgi:UPF0755 protein
MISEVEPPGHGARYKTTSIIAAAAAVFFVIILSLLFFLYRAVVVDAETHRECTVAGMQFVVEKGDSLKVIGEKLEGAKLVSDKYIFIIYAMLKGKQTALQAGNYIFTNECSVSALLDTMTKGRAMTSDVAITFPEGLRIDEVQKLFLDNGIAITIASYSIGDFTSSRDIMTAAPQTAGVEGYLFPETYRFDPKKEDAHAMLQKMITQFETEISGDIFSAITQSGKKLHDVVTVASLIEKEVRTEKDKALVSGIIYKRLSLSMPLQIDATIAYLVKKKTTKLTSQDIEIDSPYNTYLYKGLPPGPIASPGLSSIRAALYPEASEYLYYLSKPDGETVFSRTYEEHIAAKNKYLR